MVEELLARLLSSGQMALRDDSIESAVFFGTRLALHTEESLWAIAAKAN